MCNDRIAEKENREIGAMSECYFFRPRKTPSNKTVCRFSSRLRWLLATLQPPFYICRLALATLSVVLGLSAPQVFSTEDVRRISFPATGDITRADVYFLKTTNVVKAVLVLCPGDNGNGAILIGRQSWQQFAARQSIGLIGISYASDPKLLSQNSGYYAADQGSGKYLLQAIEQAYGSDLPILMYGFSGGAHFTSRFLAWAPEKVLVWCAYSAAWWNDPVPGPASPPGIVVCGELDGARYMASLDYFKRGRELQKRWTWISLPETGHEISNDLDEFVQSYFTTLLLDGKRPGAWYDITTKKPLSPAIVQQYPSLACWLPSESVADGWMHLHTP